MITKDDLICIGCDKRPSDIDEYVEMAADLKTTPEEIVWEDEGTLNPSNGHFLCTSCYIKAGMPSGPGGWRAP